MEALRKLDPAMPDSLFNRTADNWRPLFAVADVVGGSWPHHVRTAALTQPAGWRKDPDTGTQLLEDIRQRLRRARAWTGMRSDVIVGRIDRRPGKAVEGIPRQEADHSNVKSPICCGRSGSFPATSASRKATAKKSARATGWMSSSDAFGRYLGEDSHESGRMTEALSTRIHEGGPLFRGFRSATSLQPLWNKTLRPFFWRYKGQACSGTKMRKDVQCQACSPVADRNPENTGLPLRNALQPCARRMALEIRLEPDPAGGTPGATKERTMIMRDEITPSSIGSTSPLSVRIRATKRMS